MSSISQIISTLERISHCEEAKAKLGVMSVSVKFVFPTLHVDFVSDAFQGKEDDERIKLLAECVDLDDSAVAVEILNIGYRLPVAINPITEAEFKERQSWMGNASTATWVSSMLGQSCASVREDKEGPKYVHFYGYKGGQGRSTVLALFAKSLADDGYNVLVVDADVEAPSMDLLFGVFADSFSQTLMGCCGWSENVDPIPAAYSGRWEGRIDLLPCRPKGEALDLDFGLLVATAPLDSRVYERAAEKLHQWLLKEKSRYDVVIVDHRTGIASSVLPLMAHLPGSAVVCARTDFNTAALPSELRRVVRSVFSSTSSVPGAFLSFSLDPNKSASAASASAEARLRDLLLTELADVISLRDEDVSGGVQVGVADLSLNWVDWYLDRALLEPRLPEVGKLQADNIKSLNLLREALALPVGRKSARSDLDVGRPSVPASRTALSGAKDEGQFIHIPEIEKLLVAGNPYSYILGRKGTGKTRLLRELSGRGLGEPLLVAADEDGTIGLQSKSIEAQEWLEKCQYNASVFWWSLLRAAIDRSGQRSISDQLREYVSSGMDPVALSSRTKIKEILLALNGRKVFLVDGLETLVPASEIKMFVSALFEMMGTIQNDSSLASRIVVRAFVREDLAADSMQNLEQQMEGRSIRLKWSAASILNFAVSRIPSLEWIRANFELVCADISARWGDIQRGALSEQEAMEILLRIFPARLRRNNLSTATFLRLYFSDAGGDDTNKATFYPRLYLSFLRKLDELAAKNLTPIDSMGRIVSTVLNSAYDEASGNFIDETKQELSYLLSLEYGDGGEHKESDQEKVGKFILAFNGLSTPFQLEILIAQLMGKTGFAEKSVRDALQKMKSIRMFEDRPGYAGWWRVGQLYKMGLLMKYARS